MNFLLKRRMFLYNPPSPYVGGMILHLDGINNTGLDTHDSNQSTWVDLTGNHNVNLFSDLNDHNIVWGPQYLRFTGTLMSDIMIFANSLSTIGLNGFTCEILASQSGSPSFNAFRGMAGDHGGYRGYGILMGQCVSGFIDFGIIGDFNNHYGAFRVPVGSVGTTRHSMVLTSSITTTKFYMDGQFVDSFSHPGGYQLSPGTNFQLGSAYPSNLDTNRRFMGNIFALRIYTKELNSDEILYNYNSDISRFNGTYEI